MVPVEWFSAELLPFTENTFVGYFSGTTLWISIKLHEKLQYWEEMCIRYYQFVLVYYSPWRAEHIVATLSVCPFIVHSTSFAGFFWETTGRILTKLYGKLSHQKEMHILLDGSSWPIPTVSRVMALSKKMVSGLFLGNYCMDFNKISWKASVSRGHVHITGWFGFIDFG